MKEMTAAAARQNFKDFLARARIGKERVIVTRRGQPAAALVSIDDLEILEALEELAGERDPRVILELLKRLKEEL